MDAFLRTHPKHTYPELKELLPTIPAHVELDTLHSETGILIRFVDVLPHATMVLIAQDLEKKGIRFL